MTPQMHVIHPRSPFLALFEFTASQPSGHRWTIRRWEPLWVGPNALARSMEDARLYCSAYSGRTVSVHSGVLLRTKRRRWWS